MKLKDTDRHAGLSEGRQTMRKPYQKPSVRYERVFETSALVCGKIQTTQSACRLNRKNS